MNRSHALTNKPKAEVLPPRNAMALDTLAGVRGEMARLYRLALNGRIPSDESTRLIYALKEIRACIRGGDAYRRTTATGPAVARHGNHNGQRIPHRPLHGSLNRIEGGESEPSVEGRDGSWWSVKKDVDVGALIATLRVPSRR